MSSRVLILGYGAFGRALFHALRPNRGLSISVFLRTAGPETDEDGVETVYHDLAQVPLDSFDIVLVAVPSYAVQATAGSLPIRGDGSDPVFISCAKGIDFETGLFPSEILSRLTRSDRIGALSGPSFTDEMVAGKRTVVSLATPRIALARQLVDLLSTPDFRLQATSDVHGLEILSVAKNIIALGAGIIDGLQLGENFRAAFVAHGVFELAAQLPRLGGDPATLHSIGGLGDILLTCVSSRSRNYRMGHVIGSRSSQQTALSEGLHSATSFVRYLESRGINSHYFEGVAAAISAPEGIIDILNEPTDSDALVPLKG